MEMDGCAITEIGAAADQQGRNFLQCQAGRQLDCETDVLAQMHHKIRADLVPVGNGGKAVQSQACALDRSQSKDDDRPAVGITSNGAAEINKAVSNAVMDFDTAHFFHGCTRRQRIGTCHQPLHVALRHNHEPLERIIVQS